MRRLSPKDQKKATDALMSGRHPYLHGEKHPYFGSDLDVLCDLSYDYIGKGNTWYMVRIENRVCHFLSTPNMFKAPQPYARGRSAKVDPAYPGANIYVLPQIMKRKYVTNSKYFSMPESERYKYRTNPARYKNDWMRSQIYGKEFDEIARLKKDIKQGREKQENFAWKEQEIKNKYKEELGLTRIGDVENPPVGRCGYSKDDILAYKTIVLDFDAHTTVDGNGEAVEVPPEWAGQLTDQFAKVLKKGCDEDGVMIAPVLPNRIVKTGRGLQLWFDFAPVSFKAVKMVETVAKALCDAYEKFNDEYAPLELDRTSSMDIAGFKRMPGSYNWAVPVGGGKYYKVRQQKRPGRKDQTIEDMMAALGLKVYSAEERAAWKEKHAVSSDTKTLKTSTAGTEAAGIKTEEPVKAEKIKAKRKNIRSRKSAYAMLDVLLENAKYTDERNNYAFIAGTVALEAGMDVSAYLHELNKKFYDPLPARELEKTARSAASGRYHYALKTIAARLRLEISLFGNGESGAFVPNDIRNKKRAERRKQRNEKVMALLAGGLSITETAEKAGLCRSTVRKIRERMRALKNAISERNARSKKLFRETFIPRAVSCIENRYEDKDRVYAVPLFLTP